MLELLEVCWVDWEVQEVCLDKWEVLEGCWSGWREQERKVLHPGS